MMVLLVFCLSFLSISPSIYSMETHTPEDDILAKGFAAYMDGLDKKALSYFEEVIRINPNNTAAHKGLEKAKARIKKADDVAAQKAHNLAQAKYKEGRGLLRTKDIVAAIDSFHAAVDAEKNFKPAMKQLKSIKEDMSSEAQKKRLNLSSWAFARGVLAYLDRDWSKAYRIWSERSRMEPANIPLANATTRAEKKFETMMTAEREDFFRRGARAFYTQGLYKESQNAWEQVLALRTDDIEALEGKIRAEEAVLRAEGKNRDSRVHDLLEQALEYYSNQSWRKSLDLFRELAQIDPGFSTAKEYITKLNDKLNAVGYSPAVPSSGQSWRAAQPSNPTETAASVSDRSDTYAQSRKELESQLKRDPNNIKLQQELDKVTKAQSEESDRVYKDGLIAYSQGNRSQAIQLWKQALLVDPDHKKALAALKKAQAEEERMDTPSSGSPE